jgi:hypothetical protein
VFARNYCTSYGFGDAGLQLEDKLTNIKVYGNRFHNLAGLAIKKENSYGNEVDIYDNLVS